MWKCAVYTLDVFVQMKMYTPKFLYLENAEVRILNGFKMLLHAGKIGKKLIKTYAVYSNLNTKRPYNNFKIFSLLVI